MKVKYYNIDKDFLRIKKKFFHNLSKIGSTGTFILGENTLKFEKKMSSILGSKYVIGVANGTDALEIALKAYGIKTGQEVITVSNSFVSTANAIINVGAKPIFADICDNFNIDPLLIEKKITKKTHSIIPVHLNGLPACLDEINKIAKKYKLKVIEDAAQAILSKFDEKYIGNSSNIVCFSLHPTKNLGVFGDGGFISLNNKKTYEVIKKLRNHGLDNGKLYEIGFNSRLSEINALSANLKLKFLKRDTQYKINIASQYRTNILSKHVQHPTLNCCKKTVHTYHRYVIRTKFRDSLKKYLLKKGIEVKVHYEKSIHEEIPYKLKKYNLKKTKKFSEQILSLPCNHFMRPKEIQYVIKTINQFFKIYENRF
jgi:UDP-2-acetamido-2-deoxy-ribo-hexuluronate aminotransferase